MAMAAGLLAVLAAGCALRNPFSRSDREPLDVLSLHAFTTNGMIGNTSRVVTDPDGRGQFHVMRFPIVSSRHIAAAEVDGEDPDGRPLLHLQLDRHGQLRWMQVCAQMPGDRLAVLLDGYFACTTTVPGSHGNPAVISVRGPWSVEEAEKIARHAAENYRKLNRAF